MATYTSKTWVDIQAQYPTRYILHKSDSSTEQVTMEEDFGTISVSGDVFDAATMNAMEQRLDDGFDTCIDTLTGTADPTGSQGKNGDLYIKTETVGNDTSVVGMFVKIAGAWLEVSTGGASLPQAEGSGF